MEVECDGEEKKSGELDIMLGGTPEECRSVDAMLEIGEGVGGLGVDGVVILTCKRCGGRHRGVFGVCGGVVEGKNCSGSSIRCSGSSSGGDRERRGWFSEPGCLLAEA